jgi:cobaltochelatase CobS
MTTARRNAVGTTIAAAYTGFCRTCGQQYVAGESITKVGFKTWVHAACCNGQATSAPAQDVAALVAAEIEKVAKTIEERLLAVVQTQKQTPAQVVEKAAKGALSGDQLRAAVRFELEGATLAVDENEVRPVVRDEMEKCGVLRHEIVVKIADCEVRSIKGKPHAMLSEAVALASARMNILLIGPAGSGKTYLAAQVAECLGLPFAFISCSAGMSEGQLLGRLIPTGEGGKFEYLISEFVRCYENGGVFLFDEIDAADSNTLLVLTAALANGHMAVPNRPGNPIAKKHPDFVCIAAANTYGTGADRQ